MSIKIRYLIATLFVTAGTIVMFKTQSIVYGFYICFFAFFILLISNEFRKKLNEPIKLNLKNSLSGKTFIYILVAYIAMNFIEENKDDLVTKWYFALLFWVYWISGLITFYRKEIEEKEKLKNTERNGIGMDVEGE